MFHNDDHKVNDVRLYDPIIVVVFFFVNVNDSMEASSIVGQINHNNTAYDG
jgi:hypothetical protein